MRNLGPPGEPSTGEASLGLTGPSWSYRSYRFPNGSALLSLSLGVVSGVFLAAPGAILVVPGVIVALPAVVLASVGLRRQRHMPWLGGRRAALTSLGLVAFGVVVAGWSILSLSS